MKKTSVIVKEKNTYDIDIVINNTAHITSVTGKTGLLNIKTKEIIGEMDNFYTIYDTSGKFYYQEKEIKKSNKENNESFKTTVRIYDALNEKILVDGWEVVKKFGDYYALVAVKSPIDGKIHLFDQYACRKSTNIFDMAFDDVEKLYGGITDTYLVVTIHGKKGLYHHKCYDVVSGLITPIEFDHIEKMPNIIVYTKGNEKYFVGTETGKVSEFFDTIRIDEENKNIAYCKKGNTTYVYHTKFQELLLKTDYDEINFIKKDDDSNHDYDGEFFFITKQEERFGLMSSLINKEIRKSSNPEAKQTILLQPSYDDIVYDCEAFYLEKDKKIGIFFGNSYHNQRMDPEYDKINYLGNNCYALYKGESCDIGRVNFYNQYQSRITNCQIEANLRKELIYKKDNLFGLLFLDFNFKNDVLPNEYDKICCIEDFYFLLEKNGKKGLLHLGEIIIPTEYEDVAFGGQYDLEDDKTIYFALKKGEKEYNLAKRINYHYFGSNVDCPVKLVSNHTFEKIEFFKDIMVLKDSNYVYVYNYEEALLKTFPPNTVIIPVTKPSGKHDEIHKDKDYLYYIDGTYYYYKKGKFEEAFVEENDFYVTTYETDTDFFEIKTLNKQGYDAFCDDIDMQEDDSKQRLAEMSMNDQVLKKKYPTLVLRKSIKRKNPKGNF